MADLATDLERWLQARETGQESTISAEPPPAVYSLRRGRAVLLGFAAVLMFLIAGMIPAAPAPVTTAQRPEERLRALLARAEAGQPIELYRPGRTLWLRHPFGRDEVLVRKKTGRGLSLQTRSLVLVEFL